MCLIKKIFYILLLLGIALADDSIKSLMEEHQVVPDLISVAPEMSLQITYEGGVVVENGLELTPIQAKTEPSVTWAAENGAFYTLLMVCPDVPSRAEPKNKEVLLWLVMNIPENDVSKGDVLAEYFGAGPPPGTGLHRYAFLVYKQPEKLTPDEEFVPKSSSKRFNFSTEKFAEKYKLGNPIAGNFFEAQYDDYVADLYNQASMTFDSKQGWSLRR